MRKILLSLVLLGVALLSADNIKNTYSELVEAKKEKIVKLQRIKFTLKKYESLLSILDSLNTLPDDKVAIADLDKIIDDEKVELQKQYDSFENKSLK
ncbi:MAG: hypothetical protein PHO62_07605 [Sulfurimonas sp.]|uniref:hypothetical protein n=1 Tax=Sulfurimonas sp. TaxID=2022749 RepID=UPI002637D3F7|nr:hypothetical protein [Sulfurimonas sp.]MDD5373271.1 hypothetical protein [Sulfurimonas sp.]